MQNKAQNSYLKLSFEVFIEFGRVYWIFRENRRKLVGSG